MNQHSGILLVNKPSDWTSHDVVAKIRNILPGKNKVGHAGTLDPFATGLLLILIGSTTKKSEELTHLDKEYIATLQFGAISTTRDPEGEISKTNKATTLEEIEKILPQFTGDIQQILPMHSAIKIKGKKLYELARKGKEIKREPRSITIHNLEIQDFNEDKQQLILKINCSSGTYIRSLAHDMGKTLQCGAYLIELKRTQIGPYSLNKAISLENIDLSTIDKNLKNP